MLIRDWMAKDVLTVDENTSLMRATRMMKENTIRRLPVVSHGKLSGIITDRDVKDASPSKTTSLDLTGLLSETDVLRGFIRSTGIKNGAMQYIFDLEDKPGSVTEVIKTMRDFKARILSVMTSFEDVEEGMKRVSIRVDDGDDDRIDDLTKQLQDNVQVLFYARDDLTNLPAKNK